jgi:hypothetical protein
MSAGHVIFFSYLSLMLTVFNVVVIGAVRLTEINLLKNKSSVKNWKVTLSRKFLRLSLLSPTFSIQPQTVTENTIVMKKAESRTKAALRDTRCVFKYLQHFTFRFLNPQGTKPSSAIVTLMCDGTSDRILVGNVSCIDNTTTYFWTTVLYTF